MPNSFASFPNLAWSLYAGSQKTLIAQYGLNPPPSGFTATTTWIPIGAYGVSSPVYPDGVVVDNLQGSNRGFLVVNGTQAYQNSTPPYPGGTTTLVIPAFQKVAFKLPPNGATIVTLIMSSAGVNNSTSTIVTFYKGEYPGAFDSTAFYQAIVGGTLFSQQSVPEQNIMATANVNVPASPNVATGTLVSAGSTFAVQQFYLESFDFSVDTLQSTLQGLVTLTINLQYGGVTIWSGVAGGATGAANTNVVVFPNFWQQRPRAVLGAGGSALTYNVTPGNANAGIAVVCGNASYQAIVPPSS